MKLAIPSWLNFIEAAAFAALAGLYIWRWQANWPNSWIIFPLWAIVSFALHRDTPKTLGWRADNLWPATKRAAKVFALFILALCEIAMLRGAWHILPVHLLEARSFFAYVAFCFLQEAALQSLVMNRVLGAIQNRWGASVITGAMFAALHWPNPVLVPLTFVGGTAFCWLFARERNIIPLAVGQAILGSLVWWAFPVAWHHGMRIGPGYYMFP
jgi:membrane protease YdiL (CAAX protease family)